MSGDHNHDHNHSHGPLHAHGATENITVAFFLNLFFSALEFAGGLWTNSIAILSDAVHDLGDSISLGIAWYLQKLSGRGRDSHFSYGYKRFSLLGAVFISVVLIVGSVFVLKASIGRLFAPEEPNAQGMLILAIVGILVNGAAVLRLKKGKTLSERAVFLHLMEDVLGWIAVLVVSVVMMFVNLPILDPLLSIAISIWVLSNVYKNVKNTFKVLLQGIPSEVNLKGLEEKITALPGVVSLHDIHLWSLDGQENVLTLHVVIEPETNTEGQTRIREEVHDLGRRFGVGHVTVEIERSGESCAYCPFEGEQ